MRVFLTALAEYARRALTVTRENEFSARPLRVKPSLRHPDGREVAPEALLEPRRRVTVVGGAGQGKTVLLDYCAEVAAGRYLAGASETVPLLVRARELDIVGSLLDELVSIVASRVGHQFTAAQLSTAANNGCLMLMIDGLDETRSRASLRAAINNLGGRFPELAIIVSTRPTEARPELQGFEELVIAEFADSQIHEFVSTLIVADHLDPAWSRRFLQLIRSDRNLSAVGRNPLLIQVLWRVFRVSGQLPTSRTALLRDAVDYLLRDSVSSPAVTPGVMLSLAEWNRILERVALSMLAREQAEIRMDQLRALIDDLLDESGVDANPDRIVMALEAGWLMVATTATTLAFAHRSIQEYLAARALAADPAAALELIRGSPGSLWSVLVDWLADWPPLVRYAADAGQWHTVANLISSGLARPHDTEFLVGAFEREFGADLLKLLRGATVITQTPEGSVTKLNPHGELLQLWEHFNAPDLEGGERGRRFETFAAAFFGRAFNVVRQDLQTWRGELDLVLEVRELSVFWFRFAGDVLVECKNWVDPRPLKEVSSFFGKVDQMPVRLAFFVSVSGFTDVAWRTIVLRAANPNAALVVPLRGSDMLLALQEGQDVEEFLKAKIREVQYQQRL